MDKENKKSNNTGVIVLLAILLIAVLVFGIWAWSKYTTTLNGNATASVAKWNFGTSTTLTNLDLATTSGATIFDSVNNVKSDRIAPGTSGSFTVELNTTGTEVALNYVIDLLSITNKPTNLHFYSDASFTNQIDSTDTTGTTATYSGTIAQGDTGTLHYVTIYWKWPYESTETHTLTSDQKTTYGITDDDTTATINNKIDTYEGQQAKSTTFTLRITGTQVNPSSSQVTTNAATK